MREREQEMQNRRERVRLQREKEHEERNRRKTPYRINHQEVKLRSMLVLQNSIGVIS